MPRALGACAKKPSSPPMYPPRPSNRGWMKHIRRLRRAPWRKMPRSIEAMRQGVAMTASMCVAKSQREEAICHTECETGSANMISAVNNPDKVRFPVFDGNMTVDF